MVIAIDFDGTCVDHKYPDVGKDAPHAERVIKRIVKNGHKVVLWTMRSGQTLADAVSWFKSKDIELYGENTNPTQASWTSSPKAHANLYIDDAALGAPLILYAHLSYQCVDWLQVEVMLEQSGVLND